MAGGGTKHIADERKYAVRKGTIDRNNVEDRGRAGDVRRNAPSWSRCAGRWSGLKPKRNPRNNKPAKTTWRAHLFRRQVQEPLQGLLRFAAAQEIRDQQGRVYAVRREYQVLFGRRGDRGLQQLDAERLLPLEQVELAGQEVVQRQAGAGRHAVPRPVGQRSGPDGGQNRDRAHNARVTPDTAKHVRLGNVRVFPVKAKRLGFFLGKFFFPPTFPHSFQSPSPERSHLVECRNHTRV